MYEAGIRVLRYLKYKHFIYQGKFRQTLFRYDQSSSGYMEKEFQILTKIP